MMRDGVTENRILASVYCEARRCSAASSGEGEDPVLESKIARSRT